MLRYLKVPHIDEPDIRYKVVRYFTIVFFSMYCFLGVATAVLTGWLSTKRTYSCRFLTEYFTSIYVLLAASLFLIVTSSRMLIKVCSRTRRDYRTSLYLIILALTLSLEIVAPIMAHIHTLIMSKGKLRDDMVAVFTYYRGHDDHVECIEKTQRYYHCCGATNFTDLLPRNFTILSGTFGLMPKSCVCDSDNNDDDRCIVSDPDSSERIFGVPCYRKVWKEMKTLLLMVRVISPLLAVAQVALLVVVTYIIRKLQRSSVVGVYVVKTQSHSERYRQGVVTVSVRSNDISLNPVRTVQGADTRVGSATCSQSDQPRHPQFASEQSPASPPRPTAEEMPYPIA
ncbi:tetraspanin-7-like [Gigantopelta aegis]|uniref:tetraspanin-7-like n=1 Tax=Gigantopelta aegis TaxID=1735272 RepID=UPI001B88B215|nr:tetraspanin-7-like [Gigantopelta aegis]